jgi:RNA recognition motif-containing protein
MLKGFLKMRESLEREGALPRKKGTSYHLRMDQISTSFFITNFPEQLGWGDIWKIFTRYGSVSDVFIPKKVDKWGRRFGFVKFKEVRDVEELGRKLDDVWFGDIKIEVNRAKFSKDDQKEGNKPAKGETTRKRAAINVKVIEGVSFKSLLLKNTEPSGATPELKTGESKKNRLLSVKDLAPLELRVCDSTLKSLERSMVGVLKNSVDFHSFHERLLLEGHHDVKATPMGGNLVLLQSPCEGELEEVLKCNKGWWDFCFSKMLPWKPNILSESREVWLQIYGLPLHAWDEGSFKMMAGRFGVFLDFDEEL